MVIEYIGTIIRSEVANRKERLYESQVISRAGPVAMETVPLQVRSGRDGGGQRSGSIQFDLV